MHFHIIKVKGYATPVEVIDDDECVYHIVGQESGKILNKFAEELCKWAKKNPRELLPHYLVRQSHKDALEAARISNIEFSRFFKRFSFFIDDRNIENSYNDLCSNPDKIELDKAESFESFFTFISK